MARKIQYKWVWVKQAGQADSFLESGKRKTIVLEGKEILFMRKGTELFATALRCPHNKVPLHKAPVEDYIITCPLHRYSFDIRDGSNCSGEGYFLECFPLKEEGEKLLIGFEERKSIFSWLGG